MKIKLIIYLLILSAKLVAQVPSFLLAKQFTGGTSNFCEGRAIGTDLAGNIYSTGNFYGTVDFDPGIGVFNLTSSSATTEYNIYISKLDPLGNFLWAKKIGNSQWNEAFDIVVDNTGNCFITGNFNGTVDFDPGAGVFNLVDMTGLTYSEYGGDAFVCKLDASGNFVWAKQFGGANTEKGRTIDLDLSGNVYFSGSFEGTTDFDPGVGVFNLTGGLVGSSYNSFITKLSPLGNYIWAKKLGSDHSIPYSIKISNSNDLYLTGLHTGTVDFDPNVGTFNITTLSPADPNETDAFVLKLDLLGGFIWAKTFSGLGTCIGIDITVDDYGNIYSTGVYNNISDFDPGPSTFNILAPSTSFQSTYISKLSSLGNFIWAKKISTTLNSISHALSVDSCNNIIVLGTFNGNGDFDPGVGVYNQSAVIGIDAFYCKLDPLGVFIWATQIGGIIDGYEDGNALYIDKNDNIYSTGKFWSASTDFDISSSTFSMNSNNSYAAFVQKLLNTGTCACPTITESISTTSVSCNGLSNGSATVTAIGGTGFTYTWSPIGVSTSVASGLSAGIYTCNVSNSCGSISSQTFQITEPTAISVTVSPTTSSVCVGSTSTLTAVVSGGSLPYTYAWSSSSITSTTTVSPIVTSQYTVYVTDFNLCTSSQTVLLNVFNTPTIGVSNGTICSGENYTIVPTGGLTYTYSSGTSIVNPLSSTNYTVTGTDINGCIGSSTLSVIVNSVTIPVITSVSPTICIGSTYTLSPTGAVSYTYSSGGNVINPTTTSTYTIYGSNSSTLCPASGSLVVTVYVVNNPTISISSSSICSGSMYTLTPTGALSYTYSSGSNIINPLTNTTYTITGVNAFGCEHTTTVSITVLPSPTLTAISDVTITPGDQTSLTAISNATSYVWNPSTNLSCITCSTTIASPIESTRYCVIGSLGSCTVETCVNVVLDESCKSNINKTVPTAFSPNGDGVNDMYCLQGWDLCVNSFYIAVYDRWGERVYESTDANFCWDGYYKGKLLLPAVFVYYIKAEGVNIGTVNKKGNITLLK